MLKEDIRHETGNELPISGGYGFTLDDAIIIHHDPDCNLYSVEEAIRNFYHERFCTTMQLVKQELLSRGDRVYDRFTFDCAYQPDTPEGVDLGCIHFDITECWK